MSLLEFLYPTYEREVHRLARHVIETDLRMTNTEFETQVVQVQAALIVWDWNRNREVFGRPFHEMFLLRLFPLMPDQLTWLGINWMFPFPLGRPISSPSGGQRSLVTVVVEMEKKPVLTRHHWHESAFRSPELLRAWFSLVWPVAFFIA